MTIGALEKITIEHLRGSVKPFTLSFERKKKLTIVYGENGTGKSTICDAFDFLGNKNVGSLDNRGLGKTDRYWPSVGKAKADVSVKLETSLGSCIATLASSGVAVSPQENCPNVQVLRRKQILALVEAKAGDRYSAISHFIDVSAIEASEKSLNDLIRTLEGDQKTYITRIQENQDEINRYWESAGKQGSDNISWAEQECNLDILHLEEEAKTLDVLQNCYNRLVNFSSQFRESLNNREAAKVSLELAKLAVTQQQSKTAQDAADIVEILKVAQQYLKKTPNPSVCPLCDSEEKVNGLANRINEKLAFHNELNKLSQLQSSERNAQRTFDQAEKSVIDRKEEAKKYKMAFDAQIDKVKKNSSIRLPLLNIAEEPETWPTWLSEHNGLLAEWKNAESSCREQKNRQASLKQALENLKSNTQEQEDLDILLPKLKMALEITKAERHLFTGNILTQISTEVGRIYELVHPGEGLDKISLVLDPNKRASLDIGVGFNSKDVPPQAYFSESHLDTMGLCVFLALAGMNSPEDTIMVLDDVLASVDAPHADRVVEMLYQETSKFRHCIVTTHYKPWRHKYRWGWLANGQCQFIELIKWDRTRGLMLINSIPDVAYLKRSLDDPSPDPQLVCAKAGVILEAILDFLTQLYECSLPRHSRGYTLGDLLPSINKKLRQSLRIEKLVKDDAGSNNYQSIELSCYFDKLDKIAQVRNIFGCHFNQLSYELLDADALLFGEQVLELAEHLIDDDVGWPKNQKSGSYWATTGETRRLHPLKRPS